VGRNANANPDFDPKEHHDHSHAHAQEHMHTHAETGEKIAAGGHAVAVGMVASVVILPWFFSYLLDKKNHPFR